MALKLGVATVRLSWGGAFVVVGMGMYVYFTFGVEINDVVN